jgi:dihydroxy-acid dehydratase
LQDGDIIEISIPERKINVLLSEKELTDRKQQQEKRGSAAFKPLSRDRIISSALKAYASMVASADTGAIREI